MTKKSCLPGEKNVCSGPILEEEREVVEEVRNQKEINGTICAPINCKFKSPDVNQHCAENNETVLVQLRTKFCMVCQLIQIEKVVLVDDCENISTKDCKGDPLIKPWKKFCSHEISQKFSGTSISPVYIDTNTSNIKNKDPTPLSLTNRQSQVYKEDIPKETNTKTNRTAVSMMRTKTKVTTTSTSTITKVKSKTSSLLSLTTRIITPSTLLTPIKSSIIVRTSTKPNINIKEGNIQPKSLISDFLKACFQDISGPACYFSKSKSSITTASTKASTITLTVSSLTRRMKAVSTAESNTTVNETTNPKAKTKPITTTASTPSRTSTTKLKEGNTRPKLLLTDFLKICFQDITDPACYFSQTVHNSFAPSHSSTSRTTKTQAVLRTTMSLEKNVQTFDLLPQRTTPTTSARKIIRSTTAHPIDKQYEALKAKVQFEIKAAFWGNGK